MADDMGTDTGMPAGGAAPADDGMTEEERKKKEEEKAAGGGMETPAETPDAGPTAPGGM